MIAWTAGFLLGLGLGWWGCSKVFTKRMKALANNLVGLLAEADQLSAEMNETYRRLTGGKDRKTGTGAGDGMAEKGLDP